MSTKSGPRTYWVLEDYSTGKRRLLNNQSEKVAKHLLNAAFRIWWRERC
ncbi:MAG: hypothetical protein JWR69_2756 [Pedosphaera sp.]|nr:hypothetical protein [Pedosphaera sp.]